jgi:hypothetical protein
VVVLNFCLLEYGFIIIPFGKRTRHAVLLLFTVGAYRFETSAIFISFFKRNVLNRVVRLSVAVNIF